MLLVLQGERGPRVVLLQILLNRAGNRLKVDGDFGLRTFRALIDFQRTWGVLANGEAGPATWEALPRGDDTNIVDVVDCGDPALGSGVASAFEKFGGSPIKLGMMCAGVEQMVGEIARRSGGRGNIALLRIHGHGNRGRWMTVSVGDIVDLTKSEYEVWKTEFHSYIDLEHVDKVLPVLAQLRDYFAPYGMMEHTGCSLGGQPKTRQLMQKMADLFNVPVSAGVSLQMKILRLDGRVFTAYPKHIDLQRWSAQFRQGSF